ncbi:5'-nucleotidase C-terminal domain-containing protein [Jeotgalibacillus marinus]|uniref:5'-nucleotidase C-terminal domain-containing protein n=1 Tax=Jeotgalibacillus marinus TaxID=86667 RepID=A0ABV3Q623_9BACL
MKKYMKQLLTLATVITILVSYIVPLNALTYASTILTVQEAIDNNAGSATVKGYIVGYTNSGPSYDQEAPFNADTNIAIADRVDETDPSKILPVQLPSSPSELRAKFGLQTNPDNIGKSVVITGSLQAYFGAPGLKSPTSVIFDGEEPGEPPVDEPFEGMEGLKIHDIQGESHESPFVGENVKGVTGIVTYVVDSNNFYMQEQSPDDNPNTSEGILVYRPNHGVVSGDEVSVNGLVKEWILDGYDDRFDTDLSMTEINAETVAVTSSGNSLPDAVVIGKDVIPPTEIIDNDEFNTFDPQEDGIDFYESLEGMLVSLENPTVTGPQKYGEVPVILGQVEGKSYTKEGAPLLTKDNQNPEKMLLLLDDNDYVVKTGDTFDGTVTGVVSYSYTNYKILVSSSSLPELQEHPFTEDVATIEKVDEKLTVASYNIENFDADDTEKRDKIAQSIVSNLKSPDIIGLVEMQDDSGDTDDEVVTAAANYKALSDAIAGFGGPTYAWTEIAPEDKQDGGKPGGNIRVGFLYNTERVDLAQGTAGDATTAVGYENGSLTLNPGRVDPTNSAFDSSRKPLAAQFTFNGEDVIVIANHFNSKRGDQGLFGKNQPPTLGSVPKRQEIAQIINDFVTDIQSKNENANVVVLGDLNDFEFSSSIETLKGNELTNLVEMLPQEERYTYTYQGNAQVLDHILVSNRLAANAEIDIININSPYMEEHGRASDHDPLLAQIELSQSDEPFTLSIMHTNDTHAQVEGYPQLITAVEELRAEKENSLLLDAGDVFSGTLYFRQYLGLADAYFRNQAGYDAMTFGNHEFDKDSATLGDFIKEMNFPMVSTNVDVTNDSDLNGLFMDDFFTEGMGGKIYPAIVKEFDGEKVGIFGLTTEETENLSSPSDDIVFENAIESATEAVKMFEDAGIDKVIGLSHLGNAADIELAEAVDGIDVIVGGHSHTVLEEAIEIEKDEPTLIVQAGDNLKYLGLLDVTFDDDGVVTDYNRQILTLKDYEKNAEAEQKVAEYKEPLEEVSNQVVGTTDVDLNGVREDIRSKETNLGNLITDAMVAKANEVGVPTHIAIQNGGGIRASIDKGEITLGEVLTVMPFGNQLVTLDVTGQELWDALEHGVSGVETGEGRFLQVSGIHFKYDVNKPVGERVWSVEVKTDNNFESIQLDKTYTVATNAFTADGGDGFEMLKNAKEDGRMNDLFIVDWELFTEYLDTHNPVAPTVEGRIIEEVEEVQPEKFWFWFKSALITNLRSFLRLLW